MNTLKFRLASEVDVHEINNLVNSVYRGDNSKRGWTTEADLLGGQRVDPDKIRDIILSDNKVILVCTIDGRIKGCVELEKKMETCYLGMLSVDVSIQGQGLGRELMNKAESYAKMSFGCEKMEMTVIGQRQELIEYYLRRGYHISGERREFPVNDPRFGIPKRSDLYFEVLVKTL